MQVEQREEIRREKQESDPETKMTEQRVRFSFVLVYLKEERRGSKLQFVINVNLHQQLGPLSTKLKYYRSASIYKHFL